MKRSVISVVLLLFASYVFAADRNIDVDGNKATDIASGGTNATTAANARINLGLGNVNNTSDADKPVSTAQQSAFDLKSDISCFANATAFNACFSLDWITAASLGLGISDNPSFNSVHASGGNLAAANKQVTKAWASGLPYTADVTSVIHGGKHYICTATHTAGSTTEPGVGASWATVWSEVSGAGDNLGTAAASDIIALFGSGSCSGYLYSDGTCSTPSGAAHDAVTLDTNLASNLLGLSTQQLTLNSQTANYVFAAPNGSAGVPSFRALVAADIPPLPATSISVTDSGNYFTATNVETILAEIGAYPTLAFDSATLTTTTVGNTDTISVKANTFQAYDANMITWPSTIDATEVGYLNGLTEAISTSLSGKQSTITFGTGVQAAIGVNTGDNGGFSTIVISGSSVLATTEIAANTCSLQSFTATGAVASTDRAEPYITGRLSTVSGYGVTSAGALRIDTYLTNGNINFDVCNPTGAAITPGALTISWKVLR